MSALPFHRRHGVRLALRYLVALILVVIFVFPVYWLFIISFKTPDEIFAFPPVWYPNSIQFANYAVLFKDGDAATVGNSGTSAEGFSLATAMARSRPLSICGPTPERVSNMKSILPPSRSVNAGALPL